MRKLFRKIVHLKEKKLGYAALFPQADSGRAAVAAKSSATQALRGLLTR